LRNTRRRRRGNAPAPRHVDEVPLPMKEKPHESEEKNVVGETSVGVANPELVTKFRQLSQIMWTWIKLTIKRDKRKDRDIQSSSHTI